MVEKTIEIQPGQALTLVELAADALVTGSDGNQVLVRFENGEEDLSVELTPTGPALTLRLPCEVQVPRGTAVSVRQARENLKVKELASLNVAQVRGNLRLDEVQEAVVAEVYGNFRAEEVNSLRVLGTVFGDAHLAEVTTADLQDVRGSVLAKELSRLRASRIGGNLAAKEIGETLEVDQVGGNAAIKDVGGMVTLDQVAGNLAARHLTGGAKVARIGGNLAFRGHLGDGHSYQFRCDGNAALRLEEGTNAHVTLSAKGQFVSTLPLADQERAGHTLTGTLGEGGCELTVEAGGSIVLSNGHGVPAGDMGVHIGRQLEDSLEASFEGLGRQMEHELEAAMARLRVKMDSMDWERMGHRTQQAIERAMEHMQRDMERWQEQAARHQERIQRHAEREARRAERWERRFQRAASAGAAATPSMGAEAGQPDFAPETEEPSSSLDQERLAILKMVEQGQVTPAEAEMLLDALE